MCWIARLFSTMKDRQGSKASVKKLNQIRSDDRSEKFFNGGARSQLPQWWNVNSMVYRVLGKGFQLSRWWSVEREQLPRWWSTTATATYLFFLYREKIVDNDTHVPWMRPPMNFDFVLRRKSLPTHSSIPRRGSAHKWSTHYIFVHLPLYRRKTQKFRVFERRSVQLFPAHYVNQIN